MTRALRLAFSDFWAGAEPEQQVFVRALRETTPVEVVGIEDAELLIFSVFGDRHRGFVGAKLEYTGENTRPRWDAADFAMGFDLAEDRRYLRFPLFALLGLVDRELEAATHPLADPPWEERDFCCFLYSRPTPERAAVFRALERYRPLTSPGSYLKNTSAPGLAPRKGAWRRSKLAYLRNFRFCVAYENCAYPGYTSEKLYDALAAGTIPIYWGNSEVGRDIHPDCFIDARDFRDLEALVDRVRSVDQNAALAAGYRARRDYLVRSLDEHWEGLVRFLGAAAAQVGTQPRAELQRRAARLRRQDVLPRFRRTIARRWRALRRIAKQR